MLEGLTVSLSLKAVGGGVALGLTICWVHLVLDTCQRAGVIMVSLLSVVNCGKCGQMTQCCTGTSLQEGSGFGSPGGQRLL